MQRLDVFFDSGRLKTEDRRRKTEDSRPQIQDPGTSSLKQQNIYAPLWHVDRSWEIV